MVCANKTGTTEAKTLTSLYTSLANCSMSVNASCGNHTYTPLNKTLVDSCMTLTKDFSEAVKECSDKDCECWNGKMLKEMSGKLSTCKGIKEPTTKITTQKNACSAAFRLCKVAEDKTVPALAACMTSPVSSAKLLQKVGHTSGSAFAALKVVKALSGSRRQRAIATTCAEVLTKSNALTKVITASASDASIATLSLEISSVSTSVMICDAAQKTELKTAASSMETAVKTITAALATVMAELQALTGSTPSTADLTATTTATATKAPSARRDMLLKNYV